MHQGMTKRAREKLRLLPGKVDAEVAMLRAPCHGCKKTVGLAPSSTKERFGVRCLFCLYPFCVPCGEKHFEPKKKKKPPKLRKGSYCNRGRWVPFIPTSKRIQALDVRLKRIEKQLAAVLKQGNKR